MKPTRMELAARVQALKGQLSNYQESLRVVSDGRKADHVKHTAEVEHLQNEVHKFTSALHAMKDGRERDEKEFTDKYNTLVRTSRRQCLLIEGMGEEISFRRVSELKDGV